MTDLSYTNKDGLNPATGFTNVFNYHKDAASSAQGYAHGGYPEITGESSELPSLNYETGEPSDFFKNGNTFNLVSPLVVEAIAITHAPTKVEYTAGETLSLAGLEVTATLSGDAGETKVLASSEYTATPADGTVLTVDNDEVVIVYNGSSLAASQAITVASSAASSTEE